MESEYETRGYFVRRFLWRHAGSFQLTHKERVFELLDLVTRGVFTREDVERWLHYQTIPKKLQWLAGKASYAADPDHSLVACNLLSLFHAVGTKFKHLRCLRLDDLSCLKSGTSPVLHANTRICIMTDEHERHYYVVCL